jgi:hypothetical protein
MLWINKIPVSFVLFAILIMYFAASGQLVLGI